MRKFLGKVTVLSMTIVMFNCAPKVKLDETFTGQGVSQSKNSNGITTQNPLFLGDAVRNACKMMGQNVHCELAGEVDPCQTDSFTKSVEKIKESGYVGDQKHFPDDPRACKLSCIDSVCQYPSPKAAGGSQPVANASPPASVTGGSPKLPVSAAPSAPAAIPAQAGTPSAPGAPKSQPR